MVPSPTAVSLFLCEQVIVDRKSNNPSLIGVFVSRKVNDIPSSPDRFSVFAALSDAVDYGRIELRVVELASGDTVFTWRDVVHFPDRFTVVNVHVLLDGVVFPAIGFYAVELFIDGEPIADRRLRVYSK